MIIPSIIKPSVVNGINEMKRDQEMVRNIIGRDPSWRELLQHLALLSDHHVAVHKRAFELAVEQVGATVNFDRIRFAVVLMGSGARGEQLFFSDQDHAFIYDVMDELPEQAEAWSVYFTQIGNVFSALLHEIGYPLCTGNVMMSNPRWRGTLQVWEQRIDDYCSYPDWDNIRYLLIASDAKLITGDQTLVDRLRRRVTENIARSPYICWKIADQGLADRAQGAIFASWREAIGDATFSIKERLYTPIVNSVRLWALSIGIEKISTFARIEQLLAKKAWTEELANEVKTALRDVIALRMRQQVNQLNVSENNTDVLDGTLLVGQEREALNQSLRTIRKLKQISIKHFPRPRR